MRRLFLAATVALFMAVRADAAFTFTVAQVGSDVVITGTGSLTTTGLFFDGTQAIIAAVTPNSGTIIIGQEPDGPSGAVRKYEAYFYPTANIGNGYNTYATSSSLGVVGIGSGLYVPNDYISGTMISTSSKFAGQTIASLGFLAGTYTIPYAINRFTPGTVDTITIQIGPAASVPEPSSLILCGIASVVGLGYVRSRAGRAA